MQGRVVVMSYECIILRQHQHWSLLDIVFGKYWMGKKIKPMVWNGSLSYEMSNKDSKTFQDEMRHLGRPRSFTVYLLTMIHVYLIEIGLYFMY